MKREEIEELATMLNNARATHDQSVAMARMLRDIHETLDAFDATDPMMADIIIKRILGR